MNWKKYEKRKRQLPQNLSPDEYEEIIRQILKEIENEEEKSKNNERRN